MAELDTETYCRGCGAPLAWRYLRATGMPLSLDVEPCKDGTVEVITFHDARVLNGAELLFARADDGRTLHALHQCPDVWPADAGRVALARLAD
ncbi:hypothetical protein [Nocardia amikacinitolerans]|uniref:hypothetical protein n=1 Tax=Nocardia amikacinitolerans TaxID=756689 RepID=UPI0020A547A0|nr:hypothetical protein [Nocardia amikacinitolerans]MCP2281075.1 hypothetical protein [Nocardia amikacinitolerans]